MVLILKNGLTWQLQLLVWIIIFISSFISNLQYDSVAESLSDAAMLVFFYPIILCTNAYILLPRFYYRHKIFKYVCWVFVLLLTTIIIRVIAVNAVYNAFFAVKKVPLSVHLFVYTSFSFVVVFIFSIIFRLAVDFYQLNARHAEIRIEQVQTELEMLKHQVQPHFLFNTLNNIYYVIQNEAPQSAVLIARLSSIIRYFIEESRKENVFLTDEVTLLKSYIELERIRLRYATQIDFTVESETENVLIPPLLLLPMTENIFKHGIDRRKEDNMAQINLTVKQGYLYFTTRNKIYSTLNEEETTKTGIQNLRKRLTLYYGDTYDLKLKSENGIFLVDLMIPLYENHLHSN